MLYEIIFNNINIIWIKILLLGIEPKAAAWKAAMLPLHHNSLKINYKKNIKFKRILTNTTI